MPGLFVTATGTDAGKTYVSAGLLRAGRRAGLGTGALKPVLSGFSAATMRESDPAILLEAMGEVPTASAIEGIAPWRFEAPLSPDMAAEREGRALTFAAIVAACEDAARGSRLTLIEGVGGVMVPLDDRHTILDLLHALDMPILLVSGTGLGSISYVLTALQALHARGLAPVAIVLNETLGATVPIASTVRTLDRFCAGAPLVVMQRNGPDIVFDRLLAMLLPHWTL